MDCTLKTIIGGAYICYSIVVKIERACLSLRGSYVPNINPHILLLKALVSKCLKDGLSVRIPVLLKQSLGRGIADLSTKVEKIKK